MKKRSKTSKEFAKSGAFTTKFNNTFNTLQKRAFLLVVAVVFATAGASAIILTKADSNQLGLRVASFNTLWKGFDSKYPNHKWSERKRLINKYVDNKNYAIFGFQEAFGNSTHYNDLKSIVTRHNYGITSPENNIRRNPIAYRLDRLELLNQGHFKLAGEGSKYCTWAMLKDKSTEKQFYVFNAHLSAYEVAAKKEGARQIVAKENAINTNDLPVVLLGDFNSSTKSSGHPWDIFNKAGFKDSFDIANRKTNGSYNTRHGFRSSPPKKSVRIDKVYVKGGVADTWISQYRTDILKPEGKYTSDHFPVYASIYFNY